MIDILVAVAIALTVSILLTPMLIRLFNRQGFGHEIREDGPPSHQTKRGTPSMGGVAILAGIWAGYLGTHLAGLAFNGEGPSASGLLVLFLATTLGAVGFLDDLIKIRRTRNLGLNKTAKTVGQIAAAVLVGVLVLQFRNDAGLTPGTSELSYVREIATVTLGPALFVLFCVVVVSAWSNAVNVTDGLDGLAAGSMGMVTAAYVLITFWQYRNACASVPGPGCYNVRDPLDLAIIAAATAGACVGFLWWNAAPAKIFMGDTGSLALGGIIAGISVTSRTEILAVVLGSLFVAEIVSVVVQILAFRTTGRRAFRMAPFHHHFELVGWAETTVIIRFWLLTAISCGLGVALFYSEWLAATRGGRGEPRPRAGAVVGGGAGAGRRGRRDRARGPGGAECAGGDGNAVRRRPGHPAAVRRCRHGDGGFRDRRRPHRRLRPGGRQSRVPADGAR